MINLQENNPVLQQIRNPIIQLPRTLRQDIQSFAELLSPEWNDELSNILRIWQNNCMKALELKRINHEQVLNTFLDQLERILIIPVLNIPLDEESMIGSDGRTYGKMFLCVHAYHCEEPYKNRSPISVNDIRPFTVRPHEPVRSLIRWIKRYRPQFGTNPIEQDYERLPKDKKQLKITSGVIQKIKLDQFNRKNEADKKRKEDQLALAKLNEMIDQVVIPQVAAIQQNVAEHHAQAHQRLNQVDANFRQEEQVLRDQFKQVEAEVEVLDNDLKHLNNEMNKTKAHIEETKQDNLKLQTAIKETEKAIKEREKGWFKELITMAAIIGACWFASWAATTLAKTMGAATTPAISSTPGGFKAELTFRF